MEDEFDFSGSYVNIENTKDNDLLTIVACPIAEEQESPTEKVLINGVMKPKKFLVLKCEVEVNETTKTFKIDNKTGMRFQYEWGRKLSRWVGKQFQSKIETYRAFGVDKKRVAGYPLAVTTIP